MTTYTSNIPQSTDNPSDSQSLILDNFTALAEMVTQNHVEMSDTANRGKHNFLQMPEQASAPTTAANEGGLYTRESAYTSATEMVYERESSGDKIEFTSSLKANNGWTILPSGLLLKWGTSSGSGLKTVTFTVSATIPAFTDVYSAFVTVEDSSASPNTIATLNTFSNTQIKVYCSSRTSTSATSATFYYLVIGKYNAS
jgi:hypothetical protein